MGETASSEGAWVSMWRVGGRKEHSGTGTTAGRTRSPACAQSKLLGSEKRATVFG